MTISEHTKHIESLSLHVSSLAKMLLSPEAEVFHKTDKVQLHMLACIGAMASHARSLREKQKGEV